MTLASGLVATLLAGWALALARPKVDLAFFALMLFGSVTAHSGLQWAFLDGRLDLAVGDPRAGAFPGVVVVIAAGEAAGLWAPILLVPWAQLRARLAATAYALAAVTLAAAYFYFPFDLVILDEGLSTADGPPYLLSAIACIPCAAIGYFVGWVKRQTAMTDD